MSRLFTLHVSWAYHPKYFWLVAGGTGTGVLPPVPVPRSKDAIEFPDLALAADATGPDVMPRLKLVAMVNAFQMLCIRFSPDMPNLRLCAPRSLVTLTEKEAILRAFLKFRERPTVA